MCQVATAKGVQKESNESNGASKPTVSGRESRDALICKFIGTNYLHIQRTQQ